MFNMRPLLSMLSPGGLDGRLSVLIFHRVLAQPDPLFPGELDLVRFDAICAWLKAWFNVLPLDDAVRRWRDRTLPSRAAAITFDDGYADNHDLALPILRHHGLTATFFIATGYLDGGVMWNDEVINALRNTRRSSLDLRGIGGLEAEVVALGNDAARRSAIAAILRAVKHMTADGRRAAVAEVCERADATAFRGEMMSSPQVLALHRAGMQIGAHTVTHPILAGLDAAAARAEMQRSRSQLESLLLDRVGLFAYPNGRPDVDYSGQTVALARELGFDAALTTAWGAARRATDPFQMPRFTPWDPGRLGFGLRLARNLWQSR
ncbi:MAG: polysaccharide deacetylase family protein [Betaproteobacteria bacterium]|nr:polysaccharide deacetylase family protein [Betaproteobacteria bacterium]